MPHPKELIDKIVTTLEKEYCPSEYKYTTEKMVAGTRYFPDIQVHDSKGVLVCVVEIGYTRPEKLSGYKKLGISDIRWYGKDAVLHNYEQYVGTFRVDLVEPNNCSAYVGAGVNGLCFDCFPEGTKCDENDFYDGNDDETEMYVITDHYRAVLFYCLCTECGKTWISEPKEQLNSEDFVGSRSEIRHLKCFSLIHRGSWSECVVRVLDSTLSHDSFALDDLAYDTAPVLNHKVDRLLKMKVAKIK